MKLIKSCSECESKCCRIGPGPYRTLTPNEYLYGFGPKYYNTKCENYDEDTELCTVWGTGKLPVHCATYICSRREFGKDELMQMHALETALEAKKANLKDDPS